MENNKYLYNFLKKKTQSRFLADKIMNYVNHRENIKFTILKHLFDKDPKKNYCTVCDTFFTREGWNNGIREICPVCNELIINYSANFVKKLLRLKNYTHSYGYCHFCGCFEYVKLGVDKYHFNDKKLKFLCTICANRT